MQVLEKSAASQGESLAVLASQGVLAAVMPLRPSRAEAPPMSFGGLGSFGGDSSAPLPRSDAVEGSRLAREREVEKDSLLSFSKNMAAPKSLGGVSITATRSESAVRANTSVPLGGGGMRLAATGKENAGGGVWVRETPNGRGRGEDVEEIMVRVVLYF